MPLHRFILHWLHNGQYSPTFIQQLIQHFQNDEQMLEELFIYARWRDVLQYFPQKFLQDKSLILRALQCGIERLKYLRNTPWISNKEICLAALSRHGFSYQYLPIELKTDQEIILTALRQYGSALHYFPEEVIKTKEMANVAVQTSGYALSHLPESFRDDFELVKKAIEKDCVAISFASERIRQDSSLLKELLKKNGKCIFSLHNKFKTDKELLRIAILQNGMVFEECYRSNNELFLVAMEYYMPEK